MMNGNSGEDFIIGSDEFSDLEIRTTRDEHYCFFFSRPKGTWIKYFILNQKRDVDYVCKVTLIKKSDKMSPRLAVSVRENFSRVIKRKEKGNTEIKANVDLDDCHEKFWKLINYLQSLREIDLPEGKFSLREKDDQDIIEELEERESSSKLNIAKLLLSSPNVSLTQKDVNSLLKRREKLCEFDQALTEHDSDEGWWQEFFENNNWIFGYGLKYVILRVRQTQPDYGGTQFDRSGRRQGDFLSYTDGLFKFTVLVEIKTPATQLLSGRKEIRTGSWSLSRKLTDALAQIQGDVHTWDKQGSQQDSNRDTLEGESIYTVNPKGIIVIGTQSQFEDEKSKKYTFQRFRESIHGIDIITFDELYKRAKFIVENE